MKKKTGVYIHIPFCKRLCYYCPFFKYKYDKPLIVSYIKSLKKEIELRSNIKYQVDTIYIGGGSPSLLMTGQIAEILNSLSNHFHITKNPEITMELNPEDIDQKKLDDLKYLGINRLSIGVQSFSQADLQYLKRSHGIEESYSAINTALKIGFNNINLDFIIGIPGQTQKDLTFNYDWASKHRIPHISVYLLEHVDRRGIDDAHDHNLYYFSKKYLGQMGYTHYEVSNFSSEGYQSFHNLKYWKNQNYIGLGVSASGYENGLDYKNHCQFNLYSQNLKSGKLPVDTINKLDPTSRKIITGLRCLEGIPINHFRSFESELADLIGNQLLIKKNNRIAVHPQKILLLNEILTYFI